MPSYIAKCVRRRRLKTGHFAVAKAALLGIHLRWEGRKLRLDTQGKRVHTNVAGMWSFRVDGKLHFRWSRRGAALEALGAYEAGDNVS